jgi:hypothetical protein
MTFKGDIEGKPRIHKIHEPEDCDGCKELTAEEARIETNNEFLKHVDKLFDEKLGNYDSNNRKIKQHDNLLFWVILILTIYGAALVFLVIKVMSIQEHIKVK